MLNSVGGATYVPRVLQLIRLEREVDSGPPVGKARKKREQVETEAKRKG